MYRDPSNFSEYDEYSNQPDETDYSHPGYYQQPAQSSSSAQSAPPFDSSAIYQGYADSGNVSVPYDATALHKYRGPTSMEGYTTDVGAEQRDAAARGSVEDGGKRKKAAGVGGALATIGALLLKFGAFLLNFKWVIFLLKFGGAGITALISIAVYSLLLAGLLP